jgi:hypothetical protein
MVAMMGGETTVIPYNACMTIADLKIKIKQCFDAEPQKQRLLYKEKELKVCKINKQMSFIYVMYINVCLLMILCC